MEAPQVVDATLADRWDILPVIAQPRDQHLRLQQEVVVAVIAAGTAAVVDMLFRTIVLRLATNVVAQTTMLEIVKRKL